MFQVLSCAHIKIVDFLQGHELGQVGCLKMLKTYISHVAKERHQVWQSARVTHFQVSTGSPTPPPAPRPPALPLALAQARLDPIERRLATQGGGHRDKPAGGGEGGAGKQEGAAQQSTVQYHPCQTNSSTLTYRPAYVLQYEAILARSPYWSITRLKNLLPLPSSQHTDF